MNGEATLEGLVGKCDKGDTGSFRTLVEKVEGKLFSYLRSRTSSREDALDALQDTLVDVWQALARFEYRTDEGFYRFLFTIAKRRLYRVRRRPQAVLLEETVEIPDRTFVDGIEGRDAVIRALQTLETIASDIVVLRHWSGFSFKEIGTMLHMKEEAVRVRHHRALEKMRTLLESHV